MTGKEVVYAALAILGVVVPWTFNVQWMMEAEGASFFDFFAQGFVNHAASSLTVDLFIACTTFFVWMLIEARRIGMRHAWLLIPFALFVAFASAFPLFLLLRERRLRASEQTSSAL